MSTGPEPRPYDDRTRPVDRGPVDPSRDGDRYADEPRGHSDDRGRYAEDRARTDAPGGGAVDRREADAPTGAGRAGHDPALETEPRSGGKTAALWISLILGAIVLILLLIFVIQNNVSATFQYFNAEFDLPLGVAMLLAAIAGALVMALVGSMRMIQMGWTIRKLRRQQEKVQRAVR